MRPAKTQISLGIRPVRSESSLCAQWVAKDQSFLHADSWGRTHFVGFVTRRLIYTLPFTCLCCGVWLWHFLDFSFNFLCVSKWVNDGWGLHTNSHKSFSGRRSCWASSISSWCSHTGLWPVSFNYCLSVTVAYRLVLHSIVFPFKGKDCLWFPGTFHRSTTRRTNISWH